MKEIDVLYRYSIIVHVEFDQILTYAYRWHWFYSIFRQLSRYRILLIILTVFLAKYSNLIRAGENARSQFSLAF